MKNHIIDKSLYQLAYTVNREWSQNYLSDYYKVLPNRLVKLP